MFRSCRVSSASLTLLVLLGVGLPAGASTSGAPSDQFPVDYRFEIAQPSAAETHIDQVFVVHSTSAHVRADLEDFNLAAAEYKVRVILKPPGCGDAANWHDGGWTLPDYGNTLAPLEWDALCQPAGKWTIEIYGEAAAFATGSLRVHVSEF